MLLLQILKSYYFFVFKSVNSIVILYNVYYEAFLLSTVHLISKHCYRHLFNELYLFIFCEEEYKIYESSLDLC